MTSLDHEDLGRLMADVARGWAVSSDLDTTLRGITDTAVSMIPGADSADILMIVGKRFESHGSTSDLPEQMDALQQRLGEGPCVDAALDARMTRSNDLTDERRWPRFTRHALDAGVRSTLSFQLYTGNHTSGALNLFAKTRHAFDDESVLIGEVLAAHAAIAIAAARTAEQLLSAVASRDMIGQAKGMLMERFGIDAAQAFAMLTKLSQDSNTPLADVATKIVELGPDRR
ncbi:GAF and ANTAR domain-containing protein [Rhodococcus sp. MSC1_016]|jgi:GAF domain-containing protein|uniref:GAF and ANTAR domain-containing protein n=1 Tax=Rhodococcus sp. MSC1_016 TaxID=2909266 RepID=UPI002030C80A|nr:GAF and ANTAR domain-containing protein [Rhodococcus sp. MSC1_016]